MRRLEIGGGGEGNGMWRKVREKAPTEAKVGERGQTLAQGKFSHRVFTTLIATTTKSSI